MEFGSFYEFPVRRGQSEAGAFDEGFELVDDAERLGLDAFWLSETHVAPGRSVLASPMIIASAIAGRTERMKIGLAVHVLPLGNPLRMAEEGATLDQISKGRLIFGVGRSGFQRAYDAYGIPYAESQARFAEALAILRKAWTEPTFSYDGHWHSYHDVSLSPRPFQQPYPEIRVAANSPPSFERFGAEGLKIFIGIRQGGVSRMAPLVQAYRAAYQAAGHPGNGGVFLRIPIHVAETVDQAVREPEQSITEYFWSRNTKGSRPSLASISGDPLDEASDLITWDELREERVVTGTPRMVVDRLRELRDLLGLDGILAEINSGGEIPQPLVRRSLCLLCDEVMPAFQ